MRKIVVATIVLVLLLPAMLFAAGAKEKKADETYIAVISMGYQHEYWQAVRLGTENAAKELGIRTTYEAPPSEDMVDLQINLVENAIRTKPDGLLLAPLDAVALVPYIKQAVDAGIPVVLFDAGADTDLHSSLVATNNKNAGAIAAQHMIKELNNQGTIGLIVHSATDRSAIDRRDGFLEYMEANSKIRILPPVYGSGGEHEESANLMVDLVRANPNLDGVYASNEGAAVGAGIGAKEAGVAGKMTIIGFDSGAQQIAFLEDGTIRGFVSQDPVQIGYLGVKVLYDVLQGKTVDKEIDTGAVFVDLSNLQDEHVQQIIYQ
ncbi:MAG: ABC transporter substrate-binding protein [Sphaerochaetaceae bacterium]